MSRARRERRTAVPGRHRSALRLRFSDLLLESLAGVVQRVSRTLLALVGTGLGIATFVAVVGLTSTAQGQISTAFTLEKATQVVLVETPPHAGVTALAKYLELPEDVDARVRQLNGVEAAGHVWTAAGAPHTVSMSLVAQADGGSGQETDILAVSPGMLSTWEARLPSGRFINEFDNRNQTKAVVIGSGVARRLGLPEQIRADEWVWIDGVAYNVVGIVAPGARNPEVGGAVLMAESVVKARYGLPDTAHPAQVVLRTRPGAAAQVGKEAPRAARPDAPEKLRTNELAPASRAESAVSRDLEWLFLAVAGITLLVGAVGIANNSIVTVMQRRQEFGLRRCLGATRGHIIAQVAMENMLVGGLGGLIGTALGNVAVMVVALAASWTALLNPVISLASPFLGLFLGALAGTYPAIEAGQVAPAEALRS